MILTVHLLAGAAIGSKISNPFLALPLALLSHYLCDSLPHKDYSIKNIHERRWGKTFFDFFIVFLDMFSGFLIISLFSENNPIIFLAASLAIAPDSITLIGKFIAENKIILLHQKFHMAVNYIGDSEKNKKIPKFAGILTQAAVAIAAIFLM